MCRSVALTVLFSTILVTTPAKADNEIAPLSNLPDKMTCDARKYYPMGDIEDAFGPVTLEVFDRTLPSIRVEVKAADGRILFVMGNGHVGREHQNQPDQCGLLTIQSTTTLYTCGIYDGPRQPTFLDWRRNGQNTSVRPDRVCSGALCYNLRNCKTQGN